MSESSFAGCSDSQRAPGGTKEQIFAGNNYFKNTGCFLGPRGPLVPPLIPVDPWLDPWVLKIWINCTAI